MMERTVGYSKTEQAHIVRGSYLNGAGRLFGGQILTWIDELAGVVSRRHCGMEVITASVDSVQFKEPAFNNDIIMLYGRVTYVGTSSMEICIDSFVLDADGGRREINRAYVTMVALGQDGKPTPAPCLVLETEEEREDWEAGKLRYQYRKEQRKNGLN